MVYTVPYKTSSFAGYCFLGRYSIHPQRRDVFSYVLFYATLVKFQSLSTLQAHIIILVKKRGNAMIEKAFEELQIKDDFMFSVIMRNPKFCKPFLERILNIKISRIEYPKSQETIDISADAKSVRLICLAKVGTFIPLKIDVSKILN